MICAGSPGTTSPCSDSVPTIAPPRDRIWMTETASFFFTSACTSAGSARPDVSRMISPMRKVVGLWSPARMEATAAGCAAITFSMYPAEDRRVGDLLPALLPDDLQGILVLREDGLQDGLGDPSVDALLRPGA